MVVAKLLGHNDIKTTMRYAHASTADIEAAAERIGEELTKMMEGG